MCRWPSYRRLGVSGSRNPPGAHVTVRIEQEAMQATIPNEEFVTDDPLFGMWRDREDMADVAAYVRHIRAPRFNHNGSRNEP